MRVPLALIRLLIALLVVVGSLGAGLRSHAAGGVLRVVHTTPAADTTDVPASGLVSISFDRPVVDLGTVGVAGAQTPAVLRPAVRGQGRWINTSTWAFQASAGLSLATRYTVAVRPDLTAQDGARLAAPVSFSFTTLRPAVSLVTPPSGTSYVTPGSAVQVLFNQPMNRAAVQGAFSLRANEQPVAGSFSWTSQVLSTQPNGTTASVPQDTKQNPNATPPAKDTLLTFRPAHRLPLGAHVAVSIAAGVGGLTGSLGMAAPYTWQYTVTGPLRVTGATPADGATNVDLGQGLQITLSAPVTPDAVSKAVHIRPKPSYQYAGLDDTGTQLTITGDFQPSTTYTISVDTRPIGTARQSLPAPFAVSVTTQPAQPSVQLVSQGQGAVYDAYFGANIYAHVTNLSSIALSLYRLTPSQFQQLMINPPANWQGAPPAGAPLVASYYTPSKAPLNKSILVKQPLRASGKPVGPGYYLVQAGAGSGGGSIGDHLLVLITRTGVTLKIGQRQAFVWATDLATGKPVGGRQVRIVDGKGAVFASGVTNPDGIFQATVTGLKPDDSLLQHSIQAQLSGGSDVAACGLDWNNGVGPWDFNLPFASYLQPVRMYLTTERPIYRPGQPVYFKGIARRDDDGRYSPLPTGTGVQVQIQDARQNTVYNQRLHVDRFGAFSGTLRLSSAAAVGSYTLNAGAGVSNASLSFQVAEYKKPVYAVSVVSDRNANANYVQGERVGVQVRAHYFFGAPLAHAPVTWDLTQDDAYFSSPTFPDYTFVDDEYAQTRQQTFNGQQVTEGRGSTDAHGDFHFSVPADLKGNPLSQQFTLEAIVTGPDGTQVADRTQVVVNKAAVYVGLHPADYVGTAGKPSRIDVVTVTDDGAHAVGGVAVTAKVYKREWFSGFVRDPNGFYYFQDRHKDTLVATLPVRTNGKGSAVVAFTPKDGGQYRVVATAADAVGNIARSALDLWVAGAGQTYVPWQVQNNDRIQLVADKKSYKPGDTAHILVTAPLPGMLALVTVERGGVLSHQLVRLASNSARISVPIVGLYAPDVYVGVTLVTGPTKDTPLPVWKMGYVSLPVDTSARSLHLTLSASTPRAQPGQRVTYRIHTADVTGRPVQAQLAVALVDKAVLSLAANAGQGIMDTFYQQRDLGVESAGSLTLYIDRLNLNQKVGSKGGSGGGGGGQGPTRQKFPDTAYWNPSLVTDADGNATVTLTLPDNLTTWTLSAVGGTTGTLVGQGTLDLVSTKDLLLEQALPRFLTVADQAMGGAVVDNLTGSTQRVRVTLQASGAGTAQSAQSTVSVAAGGSQLVTWPLTVGAEGKRTFLFSAQAVDNPALGDRLQVSLPVQPNSIPQISATSGSFRTGTTQTVQVPSGVVRNEGDLTIQIAPALVSGLDVAAGYLTSYPYDCSEQTTSRYYGLVEATRLSPAVSGINAATAASIPAIVQIALQRLYSLQNTDGGWGWWSEDPSQPFMSAYVLEGLATLKGRGYSVDPKVFAAAVKYVRGWAVNPASYSSPYGGAYLAQATGTLDLQAYSAYVLGEAGSSDPGIAGDVYSHRQNLLPFARSYLALAIGRISGASDPRVKVLLGGVEGAVQQAGGQAHWSDRGPDYLMLESDNAATAIAVDALIRLDPRNPLIVPAVRWLMTQRVDGAWDSTHSTAAVLRALADYAARFQQQSGASRFSVQVNGATIGSGAITDADRGTVRTYTVPLATLGKGATVRLRQTGGTGEIAYVLTLHTYRPVTTIAPRDHGITITRKYQVVGDGTPAAPGDLRVVLTLTTPEDLNYLQIEDPLPAGAEPVDPSLQTTSVLSTITAQTGIPRGTSDLGWYVSHVELRDDRSALFADYLPAGTYQYSYQIHLTSAGTYHALPTQARLLYFPEVNGHGAGSLYTIR